MGRSAFQNVKKKLLTPLYEFPNNKNNNIIVKNSQMPNLYVSPSKNNFAEKKYCFIMASTILVSSLLVRSLASLIRNFVR